MKTALLLVAALNVFVMGWLAGRGSRDWTGYLCNAVCATMCVLNASA